MKCLPVWRTRAVSYGACHHRGWTSREEGLGQAPSNLHRGHVCQLHTTISRGQKTNRAALGRVSSMIRIYIYILYILLYLYSQISIVNGCLAKLRIEISMDNKLKVQLCSMYAYTLYIVTSDPTIKILGDSSVMCVLL